MVKKRSRSKERRKKSRQRNRWTEAKRKDKREKENARKREKALSEKQNDSPMKFQTKKSKMTDFVNVRKSIDISEYEQIRNRNIKERLDAMLKSKLWSEKEIEELQKSYFPND